MQKQREYKAATGERHAATNEHAAATTTSENTLMHKSRTKSLPNLS
jgi:hypothetical protein